MSPHKRKSNAAYFFGTRRLILIYYICSEAIQSIILFLVDCHDDDITDGEENNNRTDDEEYRLVTGAGLFLSLGRSRSLAVLGIGGFDGGNGFFLAFLCGSKLFNHFVFNLTAAGAGVALNAFGGCGCGNYYLPFTELMTELGSDFIFKYLAAGGTLLNDISVGGAGRVLCFLGTGSMPCGYLRV